MDQLFTDLHFVNSSRLFEPFYICSIIEQPKAKTKVIESQRFLSRRCATHYRHPFQLQTRKKILSTKEIFITIMRRTWLRKIGPYGKPLISGHSFLPFSSLIVAVDHLQMQPKKPQNFLSMFVRIGEDPGHST